jgi:hypothetical protein
MTTIDRDECICGRDFASPRGLKSHAEAKARQGEGGTMHGPKPEPRPWGIPNQPQPSFFETIEVIVGGKRINHVQIEEILAQPKWNVLDARARAEQRMAESGWIGISDVGRNYMALVPGPVAARLKADPMKPKGLEVQ